MRSPSARRWILLTGLAVLLAAGQVAVLATTPGVELANADTAEGVLRPGDRLCAWRGRLRNGLATTAPPSTGVFTHPFDVLAFAPAVAGFDQLLFTVERAGEQHTVEWRQEALEVYPRLAPDAIAHPLDPAWHHLQRAAELHAENRLDAAQEAWQEALSATDGFPSAAIVVLQRWASAVELAGHPGRAAELLATAREHAQQQPNAGLTLATLLDLQGVAALRAEDRSSAVVLLEQAVALRRDLAPDSNALKLALSHLGVAYNRTGRLQDAQLALEESLRLVRLLDPDSTSEASIRNNLGNVAYELGDLVSSEHHARRAKELRQQLVPGSLKLAQSLNNLGGLMRDRGELAKAEVWYRQALDLRRRLEPRGAPVISSLANLAILLEQRGKHDEATALANEATALAADAFPSGDAEAWAHKVLAHVLLGQPQATAVTAKAAVAAARRSVRIQRQLVAESISTADALATLGQAHLAAGELDAAATALNEAHQMRAKLAPGSRWEADSWRTLADLERQRGQPALALDHLQRAITLIEATSRPPGETPRERAQAAAATVDWYREASLDAATLDRLAEAFDLAERARARGLLATLAERRLSFDRDLPAALEAQRQQLAARYESAWSELERATEASTLTAARRTLVELRDAQQALERQIRRHSPRLAELRQPTTLTADQARRQLAAGTLLLTWVVGDQRSLLLVLDAESVAGPDQEAALTAHVLDLGDDLLSRRIDAWRALLEQPSRSAETSLARLSQGLWDDLLAPVADQLATARRLIVIPDRALQRLPFAALMDANGRYLVERLPISRAPSATVALRRSWKAAESDRPMVVFGDPEPSREPLPWSRLEARTLAKHHPGAALLLLGNEATEDAFKALDKDTGFIHFAGHTEIDDRFPMDSLLRLAVQGNNSGQLKAWEIFESLRIDAELVTLSSCHSGGGPVVDGEGLSALTQALLFAGADAVVTSHWPVHDRPTALLMIRFYHHLAGGIELDKALRQAQLDLLLDRVDWAAMKEQGWLQRMAAWIRPTEALEDHLGSGLGHPNRWAGFELVIGE